MGRLAHAGLELAIVVDLNGPIGVGGVHGCASGFRIPFFCLNVRRIFTIYVDVIFQPRIVMPTTGVQKAGATSSCSRHAPIVGAGEFLALHRDFAA